MMTNSISLDTQAIIILFLGPILMISLLEVLKHKWLYKPLDKTVLKVTTEDNGEFWLNKDYVVAVHIDKNKTKTIYYTNDVDLGTFLDSTNKE